MATTWAAMLAGPLATHPDERGHPPALEMLACLEIDCPRRHWLIDGYRHHPRVEVEVL